MDQKCCSSYVSAKIRQQLGSMGPTTPTVNGQEGASYFDCEALDDEDGLRACGQRPADEVIKEQGVGGLLLLQLDPTENQTDRQLAKRTDNTRGPGWSRSLTAAPHHLESRRDFPEPGPPDTSRGGVGGGAAIMSFRRSIY